MSQLWSFVGRHRLTRRAVSIPTVVVAAIVLVITAPIWIIGATVADAVTDWKRHRFLRVGAMMTFYAVNECFGMALLLTAWLATGGGLGMQSRWSMRWHGWVHGRWTKNILAATKRCLGADISITNAELVEPSPVVVLARHISLLDAVLPSVLLTTGQPNTPRHVFMQELLWDPCLDIVGHRTPNSFVDRSVGGTVAVDDARRIGTTVQPRGSAVIFPEGGFRNPRRFERSLERLAERRPDLSARAAALRHILPPRPAGSHALVEGAEGADAVIVAHTGFEGIGSIKEIMRNVPLEHPIEVTLRRIPRGDIPMDADGFHTWLFEQFEWIDQWAEARVAARSRCDNTRDQAPSSIIDIGPDSATPATDEVLTQ